MFNSVSKNTPFTKTLIGILLAIGAALQSPDVQALVANLLRPVLANHANLAAIVGVVFAILLAVHNPVNQNPEPPAAQPAAKKEQS